MNATSNRALTGAIVPTFFYYMVASMLGLMAITTTSLVDGVFVGNSVGAEALASVTLLVPCFTVLYAIALAFAIGGSVAAGTHIGEGDEEAASAVFSQTLLATVGFSSLFALASCGFEQPLYRLLSVPEELVPLVTTYFSVIRWVLIVQLTTMVLYYFVRADGHPFLATCALVIGSATNIALDLLFVVEWDMGLAGAAYSTAISQVLQACVLCAYFVSHNRTLRLIVRQTRWLRLLKAAYNGVAEFINEISVGVVFWLVNAFLIDRLGVDGVAAFSVVNYYVFLSLMMSYGIADALHLLVSQNFGAANQTRVRDLLRTALVCSLTLGFTLALVIVLGRHSLTQWFLSSEEAAIAQRAADLVLIMWPLFLVNVTNVIISCYLTAVHQPGPSAWVAVMRGLLLPASLLIGLFMLLEHWAWLRAVSPYAFLAAFPFAEWLTFSLAVVLCYRHRPSVLGARLEQTQTAEAGEPLATQERRPRSVRTRTANDALRL